MPLITWHLHEQGSIQDCELVFAKIAQATQFLLGRKKYRVKKHESDENKGEAAEQTIAKNTTSSTK